ncbi:TIGR00366 family protein [Halalkalibacillus halophilus]|uniref:TIGR00366 family protein n=1 Tax=Halalkalibacillus halophilus TaxID=392827 RepID=UPI00248044B2|nr:TIGR00366 family protein [Halalkalibacillus halophilus]
MNIFIVIILLLTLPVMNWLMHRTSENPTPVDREFLKTQTEFTETEEVKARADMTPAEKLENSTIISMIIGGLGLAFVVYHFANNGLDLNINIVNFTMLFLGIILHGNPRKYLDIVSDAYKE